MSVCSEAKVMAMERKTITKKKITSKKQTVERIKA